MMTLLNMLSFVICIFTDTDKLNYSLTIISNPFVSLVLIIWGFQVFVSGPGPQSPFVLIMQFGYNAFFLRNEAMPFTKLF